jgi:hypothetical protein
MVHVAARCNGKTSKTFRLKKVSAAVAGFGAAAGNVVNGA